MRDQLRARDLVESAANGKTQDLFLFGVSVIWSALDRFRLSISCHSCSVRQTFLRSIEPVTSILRHTFFSTLAAATVWLGWVAWLAWAAARNANATKHDCPFP